MSIPWTGWGIPVDIPAPPMGATTMVPEWSQLKFNPVGLYNLRRRLGVFPREPGVFMRHKDRFLQSDISWFAAGLHRDGQHATADASFHPLFLTAREGTGTGENATRLRNKLRDSVRDQVFDLATLWDRAYGGFTMVLHIDGTTPPKTPALPENLKAQVHLPPNLLGEFTESHLPIAKMVQSFIEAIGVPTVLRWRQAAQNLGWSLTQTGHLPSPGTADLPLIPDPVSPTSSHYIFPGRPHGSLTTEALSSGPLLPASSSRHPVAEPDGEPHQLNQSVYVDSSDDDAWRLLFEEVVELRTELGEARAKEAELQAVILRLQDEVRVAVSRYGGKERDTSSSQPFSAVLHGSDSATLYPRVPSLVTPTKLRSSPSYRSPSTSTAARSVPAPLSSPTRCEPPVRAPPNPPCSVPSPSNPLFVPSHQVHFAHAPSLSPSPKPQGYSGGLQAFGPSTQSFIECHDLGDPIHRWLLQLFDNTLSSKWHQEIFTWFAKYDTSEAHNLADGLYNAMCSDASIWEQQ